MIQLRNQYRRAVDRSRAAEVKGDAPIGPAPFIWGLDARALHDAYWAAHGVAVVRRGEPWRRVRGADLYLLIESVQLVRFDILDMAEHLAWRAAALTRLRVKSQSDHSYDERADVDESGRVRCIERRYQSQTQASQRVMLTRRAGYATIWAKADCRRDAWREIRRDAGLSQIDYRSCPGDCHLVGDAADEADLLQQLVTHWSDPDRAIDGIVSLGDGVWGPRGLELPAELRVVGPLWIGTAAEIEGAGCLVGPAWYGDEGTTDEPAEVREIAHIEPAASGRRIVASDAPSRDGYQFCKRLFDIVGAGLGLLMLLPFLALVAIAVLVDDGWPVLFGHRRQTRGGREFRCWKFRTMRRDADEIKARLMEDNTCDGPQFFMENDPRVTRVGHILRKCQLDELPQLWNVLRGEMSLVGPRPSPDSENRISPAWREIRLSVRPGITGLWQLRRTREPGVDFQEWIRFDTEYVEQASFFFDLKILLLTIWMLLPIGSNDATDTTR